MGSLKALCWYDKDIIGDKVKLKIHTASSCGGTTVVLISSKMAKEHNMRAQSSVCMYVCMYACVCVGVCVREVIIPSLCWHLSVTPSLSLVIRHVTTFWGRWMSPYTRYRYVLLVWNPFSFVLVWSSSESNAFVFTAAFTVQALDLSLTHVTTWM